MSLCPPLPTWAGKGLSSLGSGGLQKGSVAPQLTGPAPHFSSLDTPGVGDPRVRPQRSLPVLGLGPLGLPSLWVHPGGPRAHRTPRPPWPPRPPRPRVRLRPWPAGAAPRGARGRRLPARPPLPQPALPLRRRAGSRSRSRSGARAGRSGRRWRRRRRAGPGQAAMATRKAGSRLETEIERCRSEAQWERIPELVKQLSAKLIANGTRRPGCGGQRGLLPGAARAPKRDCAGRGAAGPRWGSGRPAPRVLAGRAGRAGFWGVGNEGAGLPRRWLSWFGVPQWGPRSLGLLVFPWGVWGGQEVLRGWR